jgi:hypothetical protein
MTENTTTTVNPTSTSKFSYTTLIHVGAELLVIGTVSFLFYRKINSVRDEVSTLRDKIRELEDKVNNYENKFKEFDGKMESVKSFCLALDKKIKTTQTLPPFIKKIDNPAELLSNPNFMKNFIPPQPVSTVVEEVNELDKELEEELKELKED